MSQIEIIRKIEALQELRRMQEELAVEIEAAQDEIKAYMTEQNTDYLTAGGYKVSWKAITSSRFDATAFKKAMPELAERFMKSSTTRRFSVN